MLNPLNYVFHNRNLSANEPSQQTLSDNKDECHEQPESVTFGKKNAIDQDSDNTDRDTVHRDVSDDDTDPGVMYENAAFVDERNQMKEGQTPEIYTEVDKAKVRNKRQTMKTHFLSLKYSLKIVFISSYNLCIEV